VNSGEKLGSELFTCGPLFTAPGGHGTEYFREMPPNTRQDLEAQFLRIPGSVAEARRQVDELKNVGVDGIKAVLESGGGETLFSRLDTALLQAIAQEAHSQGLPLAVHTGDVRDVTDALAVRAESIEHGSFREPIPDALFTQMVRQGTFYDPTLSVAEAMNEFAAGRTGLLKRSLVQQTGPPDLLEGTEKEMLSQDPDAQAVRKQSTQFPLNLAVGMENLRQAYQHGVALVTGSDAGNFLVMHGPTVQREVELWVKAGIPPAVALQAATFTAARLLRAENRLGSIRQGNDADLLIVDGNPLEDINAIERVSIVFFKGENVDRAELFNQK
jgi:imidazolonepropionase-like amidohydrolase